MTADTAHRQSGFTLVELLVSLTIMAVILAMLGSALRLVGRNSDANIAQMEILDMVSRAFDLFVRDAAHLRRVFTAPEAPRYLFTGTPERLSFVVLEPPFPTEPGLYFVAYSVEAGAGGGAELVRSRAPYRSGMDRFPGATPANSVPLLQGRYRYRFAYASIARGERRWVDDWRSNNRLPDLIRLEITDGQGAAVAPPMIARVRSDAEPECLTAHASLCSAKSGGQLMAAGVPQGLAGQAGGRSQ